MEMLDLEAVMLLFIRWLASALTLSGCSVKVWCAIVARDCSDNMLARLHESVVSRCSIVDCVESMYL